MKFKIIYVALTLILGANCLANADEFPDRGGKASRDRYDDGLSEGEDPGYDNENLDPAYLRRPSRDCDENGCRGGNIPPQPRGQFRREFRGEFRQEFRQGFRQEFYCNPPRCQAPRPLPFPGGPVFIPVPAPMPIRGGICFTAPRWYQGQPGWAIVVNGGFEVARGMQWDAPNIPILKQQLLASGICIGFSN